VKKRQIIIIALLLIAGMAKLSAQDSLLIEKGDFHTNKATFLKFSFLNVFEPEPSVQLGISYPLKKGRFQLQHEVGYCFSPDILWTSMNIMDADEIDIVGFRARTSIRAYTSRENTRSNSKNYVALDGMYKYSDAQFKDMEVSRFDGLFFQRIDAQVVKHVYAFHVLFGRELEMFGDDKIMMDLYFGLGYRIKTLDMSHLPSDIRDDFDSPFWYDFSNKYTVPSIMLGAKIGFGW
jgi:hypothetical protein